MKGQVYVYTCVCVFVCVSERDGIYEIQRREAAIQHSFDKEGTSEKERDSQNCGLSPRN